MKSITGEVCDWSYEDLISSLEYEVLIDVQDDDYQGDSRVLLKDAGRYGFLVFGWGSCSGCDALQACETIADLEKLRDRLHNDIQWFNSASDILSYLNDKDWEASFLRGDKTKEFLKRAVSMLYNLTVDDEVSKL